MSFVMFRPEGPLRTREQVAREVHAVSLARGLDELATVIALMTISTEVGTGEGEDRQWWCPFNAVVPMTLGYPHDSQSDDNRSSGYFQQQPGPNGEPWWGTPQQMMTLALAADSFLARLPDDYPTAKDNPVLAGQFAQRVQRSAYPERYAQKWDEAWGVLRRALADNTPAQPATTTAGVGQLGTPFGKHQRWAGDPAWLADVLRAAGLKVVEEDGWRERGHGDFKQIMGVIAHHTAIADDDASVRIVRDGRPDLDGPLSQLVLTRDGTFHVIAGGVAWHAGRGAYRDWPTNNANFHTIGVEAVSRGTPPWDWTVEQLAAYDRGVAAILNALGLPASALAAHREYSSEGKIDPAGIDMDQMRARVDAMITANRLPAQPLPSSPATGDETPACVDQLVLDQLVGPGFGGWPQLGGKTIVDALAEHIASTRQFESAAASALAELLKGTQK